MAPQKIRVDCRKWSVCDKKVVTVQLAKNVDRSKNKDKVCDDKVMTVQLVKNVDRGKDKDKVCDDKKVTLQAFKMHRLLALCPNTTLLSANR